MSRTERLVKKLEQISLVLKDNEYSQSDIGVLSGTSGIAMFQFYYAKFCNEESKADLGVELISSVVQKINEGYNYHTFCSGIAGAAWAIEILQEEDFIDVDCDDLLPGLDNFLIQSIQNTATDQNFYDFLHGVLGVGYYFLKRYQNTKSAVLKDSYRETLLNIVVLLKRKGESVDEKTKWESYLIREEGVKGFNLGLAHGIPSITNFLSRLVMYDDFKIEVQHLLHQSVNYILSFKTKDLTSTSSFPSWVTTKNEKSDSSRLAWCYGDLGIGFTLWRVGKALHNSKYKEEAIDILKHAAKRRDLKEAGVNDAGLCHGTCGIMHIYNHMYKETQDQVFKETADFWLDQSLTIAIDKNENAGYMKWQGGEEPGWIPEVSVLEGVAGIGLSIISYLAPFDTKWDECLLIS